MLKLKTNRERRAEVSRLRAFWLSALSFHFELDGTCSFETLLVGTSYAKPSRKIF